MTPARGLGAADDVFLLFQLTGDKFIFRKLNNEKLSAGFSGFVIYLSQPRTLLFKNCRKIHNFSIFIRITI